MLFPDGLPQDKFKIECVSSSSSTTDMDLDSKQKSGLAFTNPAESDAADAHSSAAIKNYTYITPVPASVAHTATVLVTGGAGFIGSHTAAHLLRRGNKVVVVDEINDYDVSQKHGNIAHLRELAGKRDPSKFVFVQADINDVTRMTEVFTEHRPAFIVHLAARAGVRPSLKDPYLYIRANILGTTALLEISRKFDFVRHFVYASSSSVYGGSDKETFSERDIVDQPVSPYAATKKACELMASRSTSTDLTYRAPLFTVYGPRGRPDMAPFKFLDRASLESQSISTETGSERDYTYVDTSYLVLSVDGPAAGPGVQPGQWAQSHFSGSLV